FQQWKEDKKEAQIGYMFDRRYWGQGYGTEAVGRMIRFGFEELGLQRIEGKCHEHNQRSQKVLIKNGMKYMRTHKH
ncbi:GNAT family N-acetyltransferase, partial [Klebsiella pneumoniae]